MQTKYNYEWKQVVFLMHKVFRRHLSHNECYHMMVKIASAMVTGKLYTW